MSTRYPAIAGMVVIALAFGPMPAPAHEEPDVGPTRAPAHGEPEDGLAPAPAEEEPKKPQLDPRLTGGLYFGSGNVSLSTPNDHGLFDPTPSTPDGWSVGSAVVAHIGYRTLRDNYVEFVVAGWFGSLDGEFGSEEWSLSFVGGAYRVYAWDTGLFFRAGFGGGFASVVLPTPEGELKYDDYGLAALGSLGWDTPLTERVYVGPVVDAFYVDVGDNVSSLLVTVSLGVSWR